MLFLIYSVIRLLSSPPQVQAPQTAFFSREWNLIGKKYTVPLLSPTHMEWLMFRQYHPYQLAP